MFLSRNMSVDDGKKKSGIEKLCLKSAFFLYRNMNRNNNKCLKIYQKISKKNQFFQKEQVLVDLHTLEPAKTLTKVAEGYYVKKISIFLAMLFIGSILFICMGISEIVNDPLMDGAYIKRFGFGQGDQFFQMEAEIGDEVISDIPVTVQDRKYQETELEEFFSSCIPVLEKTLLGENESADRITKDMHFVNHLEGYPFTIKYSLDSTEYMDGKGKLLDARTEDEAETKKRKTALEQGVVTTITSIFQYEDYKREYSFSVCLYEKEKTIKQKWTEEINHLVKKADEESKTEEMFQLPVKIDNKQIIWRNEKGSMDKICIVILMAATIGLYYLKDKDLHDIVRKRESQMVVDYPEIISKMTLLTGAGLTVRNSFYRIAGEYRNKKEQGYEKHYAYEEMLLTVYEMEGGLSEVQAYENFGKRCRVQQYVKLSALLVQNLKKSSSGLFAILQEEARDSFDIRKSMAKKLGEEAGTKMLVPMIMMLGIVMIIIFYPAMTSFAS